MKLRLFDGEVIDVPQNDHPYMGSYLFHQYAHGEYHAGRLILVKRDKPIDSVRTVTVSCAEMASDGVLHLRTSHTYALKYYEIALQ